VTTSVAEVELILVAGISGVGKSMLARRLAARFDLPYVELDALYHGPGWLPRPDFEPDVEAFCAGARWVTDSMGYDSVRDLLWSRADTVVWMDLPRRQVMTRVLRRSVRRGLLRFELWNGNRESLRDWRDPGHPVRLAWTQHAARRAMLAARVRDPIWDHLHVVRLCTAGEVRRWLDALGSPRTAA